MEYSSDIKKVLVIDLDVHQGNGNAVLFQNDDRVFTFSVHCTENIFSKKQQSNIDVELKAGVNDAEYLAVLEYWLPWLAENVRPDLVFYQAGVDILDSDRLGRMNITRQGARKRNNLVYDCVRTLLPDARLVITMGGGYPKDPEVRLLFNTFHFSFFEHYSYLIFTELMNFINIL